jgi:D-sedoheptulose 7-phosphate isomerase|tara:strand:+ start:1305 stop:1904 length:600 start_codon:yes stop_codon:yes gene_type:complete
MYTKNSKEKFAQSYKKNLINIINGVSDKEIASLIDVFIEARMKGSSIFFIGNGGSASTASHFVNDLSIGTKSLDKPFRAFSLCDNQAVITAIANDYGYEHVFSKQLSALLKDEDVVVAISASGNSSNLIEAFNLSKKKGATTVGISAFDGGKLKEISDISIHVPTEKGAYGLAEDVHMMLDHLVTGYLMNYIREDIDFK